MKFLKHGIKSLIFLGLMFILISKSYATIISPSADFGADDGSSLFLPLFDTAFSVEVFDALGVMNASDGFDFGFYFDNSPDTLISLFDIADQQTDPLDPTTVPFAIIDFATGVVFDFDDTEIQSTFSGSGEIGFYLHKDAFTIYTDPARNGGEDFAATFPSTTLPGEYLIGFELGDSSSDGVLLSFHQFFAIEPAVDIPEPSTILLLGFGFIVLASRRRIV